MLVRDGRSRVVTVDKLTYAGNLESIADVVGAPNHRFVRADVADAVAMRQVFADEDPDAVVHLAAESHVDRSIDAPGDFVHTNVVGTFTLLQESLRHVRALDGGRAARFRFVHVSTDEVFGSLELTGSFTETTPYAPRSPYAASKAAGDHLARAWHHTYGLPTITTNGSNNFGPYQFPEKLVPLTIQRALRGETIPVYGRGDNVRDWLYVDDHARALVDVLERGVPGETYNVGAHGERRNIDMVRAICGLLDELAPHPTIADRTSLITFVSDRPGHDLRYAIDPAKIERELGWRALETTVSVLRKTVAWYLANQAWCESVQAGTYRGERLGLGAAT
jgi:dTDP-glucose 4,6-dehydratase